MPHVVIAGPNGAGKPTVAPYLLRDSQGGSEFVNADTMGKNTSDEKLITAAMKRTVREAIRSHRLASDPIAVWKNGKAVWVETK